MNQAKQNKKITIFGLLALLLIVIGVTYAFFTAQMGDGATTDINATAGATDSLTFTKGNDITIDVTQQNFAEGLGNRDGETTTTVKLIANDNTYQARYTYNVYLNILNNQLHYSTQDKKPELILEVTGPEEITEINGYNKKTVETIVTEGEKQTVTGFDITEAVGVIPIKLNQVIEVTGEDDNPKIQTWTFRVTFINLDSDQQKNAGKNFTAQAIVQQDELIKDNYNLADVCPLGTENFSECIKLLNTQYPDSEKTDLYYHNGTHMDYIVTRNDELNVADRYSEEYNSIEDIIKPICPDGADFRADNRYCYDSENRVSYYEIFSLAYENNDKKLDYERAIRKALEDGYLEGIDKTIVDANDESYRYAGNNPNNYVCFGSGSEGYYAGDGSCPDKNLYRIIGAFQNDSGEYEVKLIKSEYITSDELGKQSDGIINGKFIYNEEVRDFIYNEELDKIKRVKIIPDDGFYWNSVEFPLWNAEENLFGNGKYNLWEYGDQKGTLNEALNKVVESPSEENKNGYLGNLGTEWAEKIVNKTWHIGGITNDQSLSSPSEIYKYEMNDRKTDEYIAPQTTSTAKIGLMYVSDYGYAAPNIDGLWIKKMNFNLDITGYNVEDNRQNNWLYNGICEWTISRSSDTKAIVIQIYSDGEIGYTGGYADSYHEGVRPVFYLKSSTTLISGKSSDGSIDHPYKIN